MAVNTPADISHTYIEQIYNLGIFDRILIVGLPLPQPPLLNALDSGRVFCIFVCSNAVELGYVKF